VVALVVHDQAKVAPAHHLDQSLLVQRANRANQHLGVGASALGAALDGDDLAVT
jgi:hypothetical protein